MLALAALLHYAIEEYASMHYPIEGYASVQQQNLIIIQVKHIDNQYPPIVLLDADAVRGLVIVEVLLDEAVDEGVGDRSEGGDGRMEVGADGEEDLGGRGRGMRDVEMEGVGDGEVVGGGGGGGDVEESRGVSGREEGLEEAVDIGVEVGADKVDADGDGDGEREEGGGGGEGNRDAGEGGFEGGERVIGGGLVKAAMHARAVVNLGCLFLPLAKQGERKSGECGVLPQLPVPLELFLKAKHALRLNWCWD